MLDYKALRDDRLELVVKDVDAVDQFVGEALHHVLAETRDKVVIDFAENAYILAGDLNAASAGGLALDGSRALLNVFHISLCGSRWKTAAHEVSPLAADAFDVDILFWLGGDELGDDFQNVCVECAGQTFVAGDDDEENVLLWALGEQRMKRLARDRIIDIGALDERLQNVGQHLRVGAGGECGFLRAAQLGRRDGLHRLGDLARVDHAADTAPDIENVGHRSVASCQYPVASEACASNIHQHLNFP